MKAPEPANEKERLDALRRYRILDTVPERDFDDLASLAARICGTPTALVTLVDADRQWFKAKVGLEATQTSRDVAFCAHAILHSDLLIVPDAIADQRFSTNPFVTGPPHIRFYAGAPLVTPDGHALGTLCVIDRVPRQLTPEQTDALRALSRQVVADLELRRIRAALESALIASEEFKARLIESSQDCIQVLDLDGRLLSMNEGGMQALEICDLGPFVNSSWLQFWEEEDREAAQAAVEAARKGGTGRFFGYFATTVTKQPRWWDVVVSPIRGAEGEPERLLAISRDVTKQKLNEEALREAHLRIARSEERWRSVFENSAIGIALTDLNGRFLAANPVYQKMLGYTEDELNAMSFPEITVEEFREANWALVQQLLGGRRQQFDIEKQYRRKDGRLIWVHNNVSLVPGADGKPRYMMGVIEDITERKEAEEALRKSEERVRLILDSAAEGIFGCDPEGTCLFSNRAAGRLLGYDDPSELLGKNMHALEHHSRADGTPLPLEECMIYRAFQKGQGAHSADEVFWRKDGACFPVEYWSHPVVRDSKTVGGVVTFIDITERKQAEEALQEAQAELFRVTRVMTMGELAASIAHEVNQPLSAIVTNGSACLRMLSKPNADLDEVGEAIADMVRDGARASEIIARTRALFSKQQAQRAPLDINEVIGDSLALMRGTAHRYGVQLQSDLANSLPPVWGDRVQLQQVVLNLIVNAVEAMSSITHRPRRLRVASSREGADRVLVAVRDSGIGLDPTDVDRIFDAFFTTKPQGIGMGLSIARSIIEAHGGRLWAIANDDGGANFQFALPVEGGKRL